MGYLANFMVYTLAMVGVIVIALLVFKQTTQGGSMQKSKYLKVIDTMSLGPRKTLYIVSTGHENFLIAGDIDKTTLISKLEPSHHSTENNDITGIANIKPNNTPANIDFSQMMSSLAKSNYMDKSNIGIKSSILSSKKINESSVMRNLANIMKE